MLPLQRNFLRRGSLVRRVSLFQPAFTPSEWSCRRYASESSRSTNRNNKGPGFAMLFALAIVGTMVFKEAAKNLDKNKPKNTFTEDEYEHVMQGLKRRVAIFPNGQLDVQFSLHKDANKLKKILGDSRTYIDPNQVVETYRSIDDDPYEPLLNEIHTKHGPQYLDHLPQGLLVSLLGRYMKDHCNIGDEVVILDFPHTIRDAIKFENEVASVSKLLTTKEMTESDICKYYHTVNKTQQL